MTAIQASSNITAQTPYEEEFVHMMDDVDELIESLDNPLHRKILINYRRHGLLEVSGRYEDLLAPSMTVRHPHYRLFEGGQGVILDGMDAVRTFYQQLAEMDMLVMWTGKQKMAVNDWGFSGEAQFNQFVPGALLGDNVFAAVGSDTAPESQYDADAYYLVRRTLAFVWPYTEEGLLIGEHVYEDAESKVVTKVRNDEVITGVRAAELLEPIIDKYGAL
ncbi:hypothetical protein J8M97_13865 [Gordonia polyisoprenivorans]|uniref:hypothetical protein n=1 Tax=Gordonia polyisoprenivorans TaxID=84595 RepID=UPI000370EF33|nr:hypothetical protein [Gordonia polyisoprenivorans]OZC30067.1 hypothetical protein CJJ17_00240 [Gordonia polyisoprenivorans]QUD80947.1 hypothetical protein J8M97_13865 [Gordonia polyisoprenivorans]UZF58345.1 hypothetical protein LH935_10410 [Gordonia polyisoprenivorans]